MLAGDVYRNVARGNGAGGEVKFPRDFGGLLLEFAEVLCLEVGDVHQYAVRDARVCDGLPGVGNLCREFYLAVPDDLRVTKLQFLD